LERRGVATTVVVSSLFETLAEFQLKTAKAAGHPVFVLPAEFDTEYNAEEQMEAAATGILEAWLGRPSTDT
jgi:hypothetical protein